MVRDVNGINNPQTPASNNPKQSNAVDTTKITPQRKADTAQSADQSRDVVEISSEARGLEDLESRLANIPDIDSARVDAIKAAISSGEFKIDAGSIADKILASDGDFN